MIPTEQTIPDTVAPSGARSSNMLDRIVSWAFGAPASFALSCLCIGLIAVWSINYLYWPMFVDTDHIAMMAQGLDQGKPPYRDQFTYQFPGEIYLYWAVGKCFGWGNNAGLNGVDVGFVIAFGIWLVCWSRRILGRALPGLVGLAYFLCYYLGKDYCLTNQRDWHVGVYCAFAMMAPQFWPGRPGRLASAVAMGWALACRPQAVLIFPGLALVFDLSARGIGGSWRRLVWPALEYAACSLAVFGLAFVPLAHAGVLGEFLAGFRRVAPGSDYNRVTVGHLIREAIRGLMDYRFSGPLLAGLLLGVNARPEFRRLYPAFVLAFLGFFMYGPISPVQLEYHRMPMMVFWSVYVALLVHQVLTAEFLTTRLRLIVLILAISAAHPNLPRYAWPGLAYRTIVAVRKGERPPIPFDPPHGSAPYYPWNDYLDTVDYLEKATSSKTNVANLMPYHFSGICAALGRIDAVWANSLTLRYFPELADRDARELKEPGDTLVVWDPERYNFRESFPQIAEVLETYYEPVAKFGRYEIRRKKP